MLLKYVARLMILPDIRVKFDVLDDFFKEYGNTEGNLILD